MISIMTSGIMPGFLSRCTVLVIIEIQSGTYLGEDDIVRLEDSYGR